MYRVDTYGYPVDNDNSYGRPPAPQTQMQLNPMDPVNQSNALASRRFSRRISTAPQMGYYDLITGEYRYRSSAEHHNQSPLISSYQGETEPPMCENTCTCCQAQVPFNWLTISLITCLMLLTMFSLIKLLIISKGDSPQQQQQPKNKATPSIVNMDIFQDMIWLMTGLTLFFVAITIMRYSCFNEDSFDCERCRLVQAMRDTSGLGGDSHSKRGNAQQYGMDTGEDFV